LKDSVEAPLIIQKIESAVISKTSELDFSLISSEELERCLKDYVDQMNVLPSKLISFEGLKENELSKIVEKPKIVEEKILEPKKIVEIVPDTLSTFMMLRNKIGNFCKFNFFRN
jgi:hypothetical protein